MILRRITANFRRQDWTAVAIELVVVVIGVFIGTQASNWNTDREGVQSRSREAFRMRLPNAVQRAVAKNCGDHVILPGDYAAMQGNLDYPCSTGLSAPDIARSAQALRANPDIVRFLRKSRLAAGMRELAPARG